MRAAFPPFISRPATVHKVRFATHLPSRPPCSYGHRFQLAEGTSPQGLICHCIHKAVYFTFHAAKLPSCLSPDVAAPPPPPPPPPSFTPRICTAGAGGATMLKPASAPPHSYCHRFQLSECVQPSPHLFRGQRPCIEIQFAINLPSRPPRIYGHRLLAESTSPQRSICHCAHKAVYFIFPAAQLPSCLSPAAVAPPLRPFFFLPRASCLHAIPPTCCAVTRWAPSFGRWCATSTASAAAASTAATTMRTSAASACF
jgi:hypothetical protein